eukprot:PhF_6_TR17269/c0_g1_i1/m.26485/K15383/K15383; MtN3 and saliva related transmembrane protein
MTVVLESIGLVGGVVIASSLIPQLWKTFSTKQTGDISIIWQCLYIIGLTFILMYAVDKKAWPILIPGIFEYGCIWTLTIYKIYNEKLWQVWLNEVPWRAVKLEDDEMSG